MNWRMCAYGIGLLLLLAGCETSPPSSLHEPGDAGGPSVPTLPGAPRAVIATAEVGAVSLAWLEPESDGNSTITDYTVTCAPSEDTQAVHVDGTTARVTGLRPGTPYRFTVAARNAVGLGPEAAAAPVLLPERPDAPSDVVAERGDGKARVTWVRPPYDGGRSILSYVVTAHPQGVRAEVSGLSLSTVVEGLTNGVPSTFTVRAVTAVGESAESEPSASVVPAGLPSAPRLAFATPRVRGVTVQWETPLVDGGMPITGYRVTTWPGGEAWTVSDTRVLLPVKDDTEYTFTVAAINDVGMGPGVDTSPVRTPALPGAPTQVRATPGVRSLTVTWEPPLSDGREPIGAYSVRALPSGRFVDADAATRTVTLEGISSTEPQRVTVTAWSEVGEGPGTTTPLTVRPLPAPVEVTSLSVPSVEDGCRSVRYALRQVDGERADVVVEVDASGGGTFMRATQAGNATASGVKALATSATGSTHLFQWNRARDVPGAAASLQLRVTATVPGTAPSVHTLAVPLAASPRRCEMDLEASTLTQDPATPRAMATGDFDRDGKPDLVLVHEDPTRTSLLRGLGNGTFDTPRPALEGAMSFKALTTADLDGDGLLDLISAGEYEDIDVALGRGDGTFAAPVRTNLYLPLPSGGAGIPTNLVARDMDGDGAPELVANFSGGLVVLRHAGGGKVTRAFLTGTSRGPVVVGDFDEDGRHDVVVLGESVQVFYGQGVRQGEFVFTTDTSWYLGARRANGEARDFNGDGHLDLAVAVETDDATELHVLLGDGKGRFDSRTLIHSTPGSDVFHHDSSLIARDLDADGFTDLALIEEEQLDVAVLRGRGDGTFQPPMLLGSGRLPQFLDADDFDGDGQAELVLASRYQRTVRVLRDLVAAPSAVPGYSFLLGDFDGDGWDDTVSLRPSGDGVHVHKTRAGTGFTEPVPTLAPPVSYLHLTGHFDTDANLDLLASPGTDTGLLLMHGAGDGTFPRTETFPLGGSYPSSVAAGDVDGDGDPDIVLVTVRYEGPSYHVELRLLRNLGDDTFAPDVVIEELSSSMALVVGDLGGDGRAEVVLVEDGFAPATDLIVFTAREDGTLARTQTLSTADIAQPSRPLLADLDQDGDLDIALDCGLRGGVQVIWNQDGTLELGAYQPTGMNTMGPATVDLDGDGWLEIVVASPGSDGLCVVPSPARPGAERPRCFGTPYGAISVHALDVDHDGTRELLVGNASRPGASLVRLR